MSLLQICNLVNFRLSDYVVTFSPFVSSLSSPLSTFEDGQASGHPHHRSFEGCSQREKDHWAQQVCELERCSKLANHLRPTLYFQILSSILFFTPHPSSKSYLLIYQVSQGAFAKRRSPSQSPWRSFSSPLGQLLLRSRWKASQGSSSHHDQSKPEAALIEVSDV